ncbi:heterokaryon incompatibility protein-domain-containing protein [Thelonectria olida]|uniref:Heterokaryon incompatibility protein-domain-containing protein n=1 Tax=Thelonectria olida TaxID=1576542 RepID=A0A9P8WC67_9HYPO|nr:heterokaryon incompatibility protein-domain-containing protein [Thelonectria olida]
MRANTPESHTKEPYSAETQDPETHDSEATHDETRSNKTHYYPQWQYEALERDEIRLLEFGNGDGASADSRSQLALSLTKVSLKASPLPEFAALSYVWGDTTNTFPIEVQGSNGAATMLVTQNLKDALERLAESPDRPRLLWIDALCIDQSNLEERTAQVAQMGEIYSLASQVLVFLSAASEEFEIGLRFLEQVVAHPDAHFELSLSPVLSVLDPKDETTSLTVESMSLRTSLIAFFAAPWWTRVWTVQEFLLAKQVVFQCGLRRIEGELVIKAFQILREHEGGCCWGARVRRLSDTEAPSFIDEPNPAHGGLSIYHATMRLERLGTFRDPEQLGYEGLLGSLMLFRMRQCSDPRDRIFGFMGLEFDHQDVSHKIKLDYLVTPTQVYESATVAMIDTSRSLDILSHVAGLRGQLDDLPSWVPDWTATIDAPYHFLYSSRVSLLRLYRACCHTEPDWKVIGPGTVKTRALVLGTIEKTVQGYPGTGSKLTGKALLDEWWELALPCLNCEYNGVSAEDQQHFDFVNFTSGSLTPSAEWNDRARHLRGHESWRKWFTADDPRSLPKEVRTDARELDVQVRITSEARCMIRTHEGQVGFAPEESEPGDVVVIVPGGRMVYVLRRVEASDNRYKLVGDCYLHCAMLGEKMMPLDCGDWEDIILV